LRVVLPRPHDGQKLILTQARRFNVVACGRRFGKTKLGAVILARPLIDRKLPCAWFAPNYRLLEEAYNDHRAIYSPVISRSVVTPFPRIELVTGAVIDYWTLDDPTTVARGRKYDTIIVDEAAMARHLEQAWTEALRPTLTDFVGSAYFLSTPKGGNYFKTLFDYAKSGEDADWMCWQMPTTTNPHILESEVEAARKGIPSVAFAQEYLAEFVDAAGARIRREWIRSGDCPENLPVYLGVDLAISTKTEADYTSVVAVSRGDDGTVYVRDTSRIRADFAGVLRFIEDMAGKWKPVLIGIEQVQYQAAVIQELSRRTKLPIRGIKPDKDKVTRFAPLEARYEQGQVMHCKGLPSYFEDELLSFPIGKHDDCVDALAYAWHMVGQRRGFFAAE